jgi:hypothetical protein
MEKVNCNICAKFLDLDEVEFHIKEGFHVKKKDELLNQSMMLQHDVRELIEMSAIDYWRKNE